MTYSFTEKKRIRNNFGTRESILKEPDLLSIQINSFNSFIQEGAVEKENIGLHSVFQSVFPITALNGYAEIEYLDYELQEPKYNVKECKLRGVTYAATLQVKLNLVLFDKNGSNLKKKRRVKQVIEESVYLGQLPLMTDTGTFVINGTERVVVSQLHRSPGVIFEHDKGKTHSSGKILFSSRVIPYRGSWLDFEFDHHEHLFVRIDRRRKLPVTTLLRAMGLSTNEIIDTFFDHIDSFTQKRSVIYFDAPGSGGWKDNSSTNIHNQRIHSLFESSLKPLNPCISEMRLIKDKEEVKNMQDAADLASEAHMSAMRVASPGLYEHNVASVFDSQFTNGNSEHSYPPIVASGENACILHYNENNQELQDGDLLLIDAGCEINGYASDITRTFPINGKFSEAQKEIYGIVLSAQKSAIDSIKPGVSCNKPHETACQIITDGLIKLGIMKSPEDLTKFYMHGTGHWLGLDVHDVGVKLINDEFREFKSGMVTTVEPGIYIRRDDKIESKYWGIGVRIEDDVLVTEAGNHVLSKKAVKDIDEIEYLMSQR